MHRHTTRNRPNSARVWWLAGLLATLPIVLQAQSPAVRFDHLSIEDGLSHSAIGVIEQDRHGFLWFGTRDGLNRYDGGRFRVFQHDPEDPDSLSADFVGDLLVDRHGELWIATEAGLDLFHRGEERFIHYRHDPNDPGSLSNDQVSSIFEDHTGSLWVLTSEGLNRLRPNGTFDLYLHDPTNEHSLSDSQVGVMAEDREGRLWVGTYNGLNLFDRRTATFRQFRHDPADPHSLSDNPIYAIEGDAEGNLWVGTAKGLNHFDRETERFSRYRHDRIDLSSERIWELLVDREGELWVGTYNAGLVHIPRSGLPTQYRHEAADPWSLNGDRVSALFEDQSGILWAGTYVGLNKYDRRREQFAIYRREPQNEETLSDSNIAAILEERSGVLWVGTWDKGLNRLDRQRGTVTQYRPKAGDPRSLPDETIQALCEDRSGALWVATWGGLARLDQARESFTVYHSDPEDPASLESDAVLAIHEDRQGQIWVGTLIGLSRFEPTSESFVRYPLDDGFNQGVGVILEDRTGTLWLGSEAGLYYLDTNTTEPGEVGHLQHDPDDDNSPSPHGVNTLHEDREGNLWIGTDGAGLDRLDPARETFTHYREEDGLADNVVLGLLEDETGQFWITTSQGLSRLDPRSGTFHNFTVEDGLQSSLFSYRSAFRSPRGEMFFGGPQGLNAFFPQQIRTDSYVPPVVLTDFQLFNESVPLAWKDPASPLKHSIVETPEIHLSHRDAVFSFEFAGLYFANPRKNLYSYQLEGFDSGWIATDGTRRLATYTNLNAGTYRFRVRGGNAAGVWNDEEATVRIVIAPPPWKSWWAYLLYALAFAALVLGYGRSHQRELRRERQATERERQATERERAVSQRLREVDKLKDDFLANTSHELRTPLYGITGLAESVIDGAAGEISDAVRGNLSMIVASGRRLGHLVNDILDFSKLRHKNVELNRRPVELHALVDVVLTLSRPLAEGKKLRLENHVPADLPAADADENRLQQILYNLLGNAIKFTEEGSIEITAEAIDSQLVVRVVDTGIGMRPEQQQHIFDTFEQADASVEREYGGTGLGLAVTRQLVELHGGEIWVDSTLGEGATFSFSLPATSEEVDPAIPPIRPIEPAHMAISEVPMSISAMVPEGPAGEFSPIRSKTVRILAVDDEPVNRQVLTNYLALEHFDLVTASGGEEALRLIEEQHFDLVLLDVMMPKVSGYEVCRALREKHPMEKLPILFLTAKNQTTDIVTGLSLGANDFLTKPISKSELLARVRPHLDLLAAHRHVEYLVEKKISEIQILEGLLSICASCKRICDEKGDWNEIETFIDRHSEAEFSHGICPDCALDLYSGYLEPEG